MALSIVLCDEDERYLVPLELKFTEEFGEKAEIIVITDKEYLKSFLVHLKILMCLLLMKTYMMKNMKSKILAMYFY